MAKTILIVEDEPGVIKSLTIRLKTTQLGTDGFVSKSADSEEIITNIKKILN